METTTSVAAVAAPSGNVVDNAISKLLDGVIGSMFSPAKWERNTSKEGVAGMVSHASGDALNETTGEVLNLISYSNGKSSFTPSVEVKTAKGIFVANVQGSLTLKAGQKVELSQSSFTNKKGEVVPCLIVVK
jgi:hypothetical protein